ncbi:hypothetical protein FOTG_18370 [Fusarium oxysporum f. sp. vasinfectum 25433]|uniref:Uncharacterized protein n=1 Tax=Fusarium oxysporum f. sp. vasinfectum 25433 TaxID=1089449 RepID=X0KHR7_FUSOX|nr:hypothetical protein FOTG_18882 [Fusarium oxysporum f. sp. vasinfectum 25433]EXM13169.1 hypothetical protein FOTG_18370 [Fusarium oxysporum f. sp. vasinfectum 25433]
MRLEISLHLIHRPFQAFHGLMDRRGSMSRHGSSVSITRYTFRIISHPDEHDRSELEYPYQAPKPIYYYPPLHHDLPNGPQLQQGLSLNPP